MDRRVWLVVLIVAAWPVVVVAQDEPASQPGVRVEVVEEDEEPPPVKEYVPPKKVKKGEETGDVKGGQQSKGAGKSKGSDDDAEEVEEVVVITATRRPQKIEEARMSSSSAGSAWCPPRARLTILPGNVSAGGTIRSTGPPAIRIRPSGETTSSSPTWVSSKITSQEPSSCRRSTTTRQAGTPLREKGACRARTISTRPSMSTFPLSRRWSHHPRFVVRAARPTRCRPSDSTNRLASHINDPC